MTINYKAVQNILTGCSLVISGLTVVVGNKILKDNMKEMVDIAVEKALRQKL